MLQPQPLHPTSSSISGSVQAYSFEQIEELYRTYSKNAYAFALKMLREPGMAEDAVQEAFLRFYRCPLHYDAAKGSFLTWLLAVVRNICLDQIRKINRHPEVNKTSPAVGNGEETPDPVGEIADGGLSVEEEVWLKIERSNIQAALKAIPFEQKHLVELSFFQGLTHKEIETATGIPLGTVKSRIRQGLLKLKVHLDADRVMQQFN